MEIAKSPYNGGYSDFGKCSIKCFTVAAIWSLCRTNRMNALILSVELSSIYQFPPKSYALPPAIDF